MSEPTHATLTITDDRADHVDLRVEFGPDVVNDNAYSHYLAVRLLELAQAIAAGKEIEVHDE